MRVLVTGAGGYLGAHISRFFQGLQGVTVLATTNRLPAPSGVDQGPSLRVLDITDARQLKDVLVEPFDICVHAASVNDAFVDSYADQALRVNAGGTRLLLEQLASCGIHRFIYLSTIHVYGHQVTQVDDRAAPAPMTDYAVTHAFGEMYAAMFNRTSGLSYTAARLSNVYGMPLDKGSSKWYLLVNDLVRMAHSDGTIRLKSNGKSRRDFISVGDVCEALRLIASFPPSLNGPINVTTGYSRSVREVAGIVQEEYQARYGRSLGVEINEADVCEPTNATFLPSESLISRGWKCRDELRREVRCIFELLEQRQVRT